MGLTNILKYIENKRIIREFEKNPKNYDGKTLLANTEYLNAVTDVSIYEEFLYSHLRKTVNES
jgi:hypothetical protein